jgi:hypothetical protein
MQTADQKLIYFFEQVAQKNQAQLKKLKQERGFCVEKGRWCFTLPDLYSFLKYQYVIFSCIDYKQFRKLVFNCPVNQTVKSYGAEITIVNNLSKVDKSSYALVWQTRD